MKIVKYLVLCVLFLSIYFYVNIIRECIIERNFYEIIDLGSLEIIKKDEKKAVVYFYKPDCPACSKFKGTLNEVIKEKNITVYAINVNDDNNNIREIMHGYNVNATPTIEVIKDGKVTQKKVGALTKKELLKFLKEE